MSIYSLLFQRPRGLHLACLENMPVLLNSVTSFAYLPKGIPTTLFSNIPLSFLVSLPLFYLFPPPPPLLAPPFHLLYVWDMSLLSPKVQISLYKSHVCYDNFCAMKNSQLNSNPLLQNQ